MKRREFTTGLVALAASACAGTRIPANHPNKESDTMDAKDNVKVIEDIYGAFGRGDIAQVLARMKDGAHWDFNVTHSDVPWHVPATGPVEIKRFLGAFVENVALEAFEPRQFIASGNEVIAHLHLAYTVKTTGRRVDEEQLQWWSLSEGKVTRLRHFEDTAQVIGAWRGTAP